jgi:hypothetical protein
VAQAPVVKPVLSGPSGFLVMPTQVARPARLRQPRTHLPCRRPRGRGITAP